MSDLPECPYCSRNAKGPAREAMSDHLNRAAVAEVRRLQAGIKALIVDNPDKDDLRLSDYYYALSVAFYLLDVASERLTAPPNPTEGETDA